MDDDLRDFGQLLEGHLAAQDRSQNWLALRLQVSASTVNRWCHNSTYPQNAEIIQRMAEILHLSPPETEQLLQKAGFAVYLTSKGDHAPLSEDPMTSSKQDDSKDSEARIQNNFTGSINGHVNAGGTQHNEGGYHYHGDTSSSLLSQLGQLRALVVQQAAPAQQDYALPQLDALIQAVSQRDPAPHLLAESLAWFQQNLPETIGRALLAIALAPEMRALVDSSPSTIQHFYQRDVVEPWSRWLR